MKIGIITASDKGYAGQRPDKSGPALEEIARERGYEVAVREILPDDRQRLAEAMRRMADQEGCDVVLVTGGTGFSPRDVTPEATGDVVERRTPGFDEAMRAASLRVTPHGMLSRGISGIRGGTIILNLPGSPKAARENFAVVADVLPHALEMLQGGGHGD